MSFKSLQNIILIAVNLIVPLFLWWSLLPIPQIPSDDQILEGGIEDVGLCLAGKVHSESVLCLPKPDEGRYYTKPTLSYLGGITYFLINGFNLDSEYKVSGIEAMSLLNFLSIGFLIIAFLFITKAEFQNVSFFSQIIISLLFYSSVSIGASLLWNGYGVLQFFLVVIFSICLVKSINASGRTQKIIMSFNYLIIGCLLFFLHTTGLFWMVICTLTLCLLTHLQNLKGISFSWSLINKDFLKKWIAINIPLLIAIVCINFYSKIRFGGHSYLQDFMYGLSENRYVAVHEPADSLPLKLVLPAYYLTIELALVLFIIVFIKLSDLKKLIKDCFNGKITFTAYFLTFSVLGTIFLTLLNNEKLLRLFLPLQIGLFALIQIALYGYGRLTSFKSKATSYAVLAVVLFVNFSQLTSSAKAFVQMPQFFALDELKDSNILVLKNDEVWNKVRRSKLAIYYPGKDEMYLEKKLVASKYERISFVDNIESAKVGDLIVSSRTIQDKKVKLIKTFEVVPFNMALANYFQAPVKIDFFKNEVLSFDFYKFYSNKSDEYKNLIVNVYQRI